MKKTGQIQLCEKSTLHRKTNHFNISVEGAKVGKFMTTHYKVFERNTKYFDCVSGIQRHWRTLSRRETNIDLGLKKINLLCGIGGWIQRECNRVTLWDHAESR